jgi:hypothetical protein
MYLEYDDGGVEGQYTDHHTGDGGGNVGVRNGLTPSVRTGDGTKSFGPLTIRPWDSTTVVVDELSFDVLDKGGVLPFLNTMSGMPHSQQAAGAAALSLPLWSDTDDLPDGQTPVGRRDVMIATGVAAAAAAAPGSAFAQTDDETETAVDSTHNVVEFEIVDAPRGFAISIADRIEQFLPVGSKYYVEINGSVSGSFETGTDSNDQFIVPSGTTGSVRVVAKDGIDLWNRILADFRNDEPLTYTFTLDEPVSSYERGETIRISDQPIIVDALLDAGPDKTVVKVGETAISNIDEGSESVGNWYLQDEAALVYDVGIDAPQAEAVELTINAGVFETIAARYGLDSLAGD